VRNERNYAGELSLSDEQKINAWVKHYSKLLNVEFEWPSDNLPDVAPTLGPVPLVTSFLIQKAIKKMQGGQLFKKNSRTFQEHFNIIKFFKLVKN